jgi:hypothetical protein
MSQIFEILIIGSLIALILFLAPSTVLLKLRNTKMASSIIQLTLDKQAMSQEIDRLAFVVANSPELNEEFVKFLSQSREEAYQYIEDVQRAIDALSKSVINGDDDEKAKRFLELLNFLPSNQEDVVN